MIVCILLSIFNFLTLHPRQLRPVLCNSSFFFHSSILCITSGYFSLQKKNNKKKQQLYKHWFHLCVPTLNRNLSCIHTLGAAIFIRLQNDYIRSHIQIKDGFFLVLLIKTNKCDECAMQLYVNKI